MSELRANTDVMRTVADTVSKSAENVAQTANRVSSLSNQLDGKYQGQLRNKVGPIITSAVGDGMRLNNQSQSFGTRLRTLATDIDKTMQQNAGSVSTSLVSSVGTRSGILGFFDRARLLAIGTITSVLVWAGFVHTDVPVTQTTEVPPINTDSTRPPASQDGASTSALGKLIDQAEEEKRQRGLDLVRQYDGKSYAEGTYNSKDSYSAHPVVPPVTNKVGERDPNMYDAVLNEFGVEENPRYAQRNNNTYCNIYVWDATSAMHAEIPHWVDPRTGQPAGATNGMVELSANGVVSWLQDHGTQYGWHAVTAEVAQAHANTGGPAVVVWANPTGAAGHVAMVRPGTYDATTGPQIAQAGGMNINKTTVSETFGDRKVLYYIHD